MNEAQLFPDRRARSPGTVRAARRLAIVPALVALLSLGACSSTPDWANPVQWYKGATSVFDSDKEQPSEPKTEEAAELRNRPVPGAGEPFPNLASVPARPKSVTSADERKRITASLVADRDNARYVDAPPPRPTVIVPPPPPYVPPSSATSSSSSSASTNSTSSSSSQQPPSPPPVPAPAPAAAPPPAASVEPPPPPAPVTPPPRPTQSSQASPPQAPSVTAAPRPRVADSQPTPPPAATPAPPDVVAATPAPLPSHLNGPQPDAVVLFNDNSSQVSAEQRRGLAAVARDAKARNSTVRVVGRSSPSKSQTQAALLATFNMSWNRAHAVADALTRLGVPAAKIQVEAETSPDAAPEVANLPQGDAGLRRADIYLE
jgi:outer membrane protein OmpA-like peptidoglycan-associated protein